ncbi:MAG TPA: DUF705 domain-containing protein [Tepidisphaeraceae bacterium]|jgi:hypothetical protein|nr:DUF705 domain-containing protein [Tepidisphaeraceae bacterium]
MTNDRPHPPLVVFVDVDDTLIRSVGTKRIPISATIDHVRSLHADGAVLYCWSSGGGEYARTIAQELMIDHYFVAFLPKPQVLVDDQEVGDWRRLLTIHPMQCETESVASYRLALEAR